MSTKIKGVVVTTSQAEVYAVLAASPKGLPDHVLVPVTQHIAASRLSSSGIRTRRKELVDAGLVKVIGSVSMPSGRQASIFKVVR